MVQWLVDNDNDLLIDARSLQYSIHILSGANSTPQFGCVCVCVHQGEHYGRRMQICLSIYACNNDGIFFFLFW